MRRRIPMNGESRRMKMATGRRESLGGKRGQKGGLEAHVLDRIIIETMNGTLRFFSTSLSVSLAWIDGR